MGLAAFIRSNEQAIVAEWEAFARASVPAAAQMNRAALRNHILDVLRFIADDIETPKSLERSENGNGPGTSETVEPAATVHGEQRFRDGFDTVEMISEFRALRASVVKLWRAEGTKTEGDLPDLVRFNEAIDQAMTESLDRFTKKLDHSRSLFLGTLVHDLRNPLAAVSNCVQLLLMRGKLDGEDAPVVSQIGKSTSRINQLVSDLIDVVRVRLGKGMPIAPAPMDIGTVVKQVAEEVQTAHPAREISVETSGNLEGEWDRVRVGQVLSNLIGNAVQHGIKTSQIDVAARGNGQAVILSVHNEGSIPADEVTTIFNPLTRGKDEGQSPTTGLGLGLFIAREIVTAHGGEISVISNEKEGTTFTAHLPRNPPEEHAG